MDYYSDEEDIEYYGEADMSNEDMWKIHWHSDFKILEVVKASAQLVSGILYYITFKAQDANNGKIETFQGKIWRHIPKENGEPDDEVLECRIKPTTS